MKLDALIDKRIERQNENKEEGAMKIGAGINKEMREQSKDEKERKMRKKLFFLGVSILVVLLMGLFSLSSSVFALQTDKDVTLDDGDADSPKVIMRDETGDGELTLQKIDAGAGDLINTEGRINLKPSGDVDDFIYLFTEADLIGIYWEGYYPTDAGIRIGASGKLEYRDEDSGTWVTFDSLGLAAGPTSLDDLLDVVISGLAQGQILYYDGTNWVNLAPGTSGEFLKTQGAGEDPVWADAGAGAGSITAVGSMTSGDAFSDATADDDWLGLGAAAGRIEFDDQTTDEINFLNANVGIGTSTPDTDRALHVVGDAKIDGDLHMIGAITHDSPVVFRDGLEIVDDDMHPHFHIEYEQAGHHTGETRPDTLLGAISFESIGVENANNMEIVFWDADTARPLFIMNEGGTNRASTFDRSLQIGKALGAAAIDGDYTSFEGFNYIDGATGTTGADLGVEDDIEAKGSIYAQGNILAEGGLRLADSDASNYVAFQAPATVTSNVTWTLPDADGTNGQVLGTNGSGALSWTTISGTVTDGTAADNTLRWDGSGWVQSTALTNDDSDITVNNQGDIRLADADSSHYVALQSPATVAANVTLTLPVDDGDANQVLKTDGSGALSWTTASAGDITAVGDVAGGAAFDGTQGNALQFEGTTADAFEITLEGADPGSDVTLTLPAVTGNLLTQEQVDTSAELSDIIGDETGTGALVFAGSPSLTSPSLTTPTIAGSTITGVNDAGAATSFEIPNSATPTVDAAGEIAVDTTIANYTGMVKYFTTEELTVLAVPTANLSTTDGQVVAYNAANDELEFVSVGAGDITGVTAGTGLSGGGDSGAVSLAIDSTVATLSGAQILTNKTLTLPQINDTSSDHQYIFAVSELTDDRTVTLPLLAGNDTFVLADFSQTLTNKTLTSPVLDTGVSGTAVLNEDTMTSNSDTQLATQQSIKAYVDSQVGAAGDITGVTAGTGLSGGGDSGAVSLAIDSTVATLSGAQILTNKTLTDSTTYVQDETDTTKKMQLQLSGITTDTTRTLTVPDANGTIMTNVVEDTTPQLGGDLDVNGNNITSSAGIDMAIGEITGNDFTVDTDKLVVEGDTGNVGIGTASPGALFDISGATGTEIIRFTDETTADSVGFYTGNGDPSTVITAEAGSLYLDQAGKVFANTDGVTAWTDLTASGGSIYFGASGATGTLSGSTPLKIPFNTGQVIDPAGGFDDANDWYVIPEDGDYLVSGGSGYIDNGSGAHWQMYLYKNGSTMISSGYSSPSTNDEASISLAPVIISLVTGDTIHLAGRKAGTSTGFRLGDCSFTVNKL